MASMSKSASTSSEKLDNSRSLAWQYFEHDKATQIATCSLWKAKLKSVGGSTGSLHLHSKHKITLLKRKSTRDDDDKDASRPSVEPPSACDGSASATKRQDKGNLTKYFGRYNSHSQIVTTTTPDQTRQPGECLKKVNNTNKYVNCLIVYAKNENRFVAFPKPKTRF